MKYIIEFEDEPINHDDRLPALYQAKGFNALMFDETALSKLTKYHEEEQFDYCDNCLYTKYDSTEEPCKSCCYCYMDRFVDPCHMSESILKRILENMDLETAVDCLMNKDCSRCKYSRLPLNNKCRGKAKCIVSTVLSKIGECI